MRAAALADCIMKGQELCVTEQDLRALESPVLFWIKLKRCGRKKIRYGIEAR